MFEDEEWRIIEEFPNYMVSNYGRVKHTERAMARKVTVNERGFPVVVLFRSPDPSRYLRQVNKLVAEAFVPTPDHHDGTLAVWHIDGDLTNCSADNLRWEPRAAVLEWNEMNRGRTPYKQVGPVKNNRTGAVYKNTFECALAEGELESKIIWRIERQARHIEDESAPYMYLLSQD